MGKHSSSGLSPVQIICTPAESAAKVNQVINQWFAQGVIPAPVMVTAMPDGQNLMIAMSPQAKKADSPDVFAVSYNVSDWIRGKLFNNTGFKGFVILGTQPVYWGTNSKTSKS